MSTYGKHYPNRHHECCSCRNKRKLRRQAARRSIADTKFGIGLSDVIENEEPSNEQQEDELKTSKEIMEKSLVRLRDAAVPQVGSTRKIVRAFWIVIYIGLFLFFSVSFISLVEKYMNYPTNMKLIVETRPSLPFPAVSVCNENPVRKSMIARLKKFNDLVVLDKYMATLVDVNAQKLKKGRSSKVTIKCPNGYHQCKESEDCIPPEWICDGKIHCRDGGDENFTSTECALLRPEEHWSSEMCAPSYVECTSSQGGYSKICAKQCDGISECVGDIDESDESGCTPTKIVMRNIPLNAEERAKVIFFGRTPKQAFIFSAPEGYYLNVRVLDMEVERCDNGRINQCRDVVHVSPGNCSHRLQQAVLDWRKMECIPESPSIVCGHAGFSLPNTDGPSWSFPDSVRMVTAFFYADINIRSSVFLQCFIDKSVSPEDSCQNYTKSWIYPTNGADLEQPQINLNFKNQTQFNYFDIYRKSSRADFADFRKSVFFDQETVRQYGHKKPDFIAQCTFDNNECYWDNIVEFEDPNYGKCFTFNSQRSATGEDAKKTYRIGDDFGLKFTLFIDAEEYVGILAQKTGARVAIHDPKNQPIMKTQSIAISAGEATFLSLQMEEIHRLGSKYSKCNDNWITNLSISGNQNKMQYTTENCLHLCILTELVKRCKCIDAYDITVSSDENILAENGTLVMCSHENETSRNCRKKVYDDYAEMKFTCSWCLPPCHSREFRYTASRSHWPSIEYGPYFASKLFKQKSGRLVAFAEKFANSTKDLDRLIKEDVRENFVRLEVFYNSLQFRSLNETASYEFVDLLSDFGGNISLWLGWSIFALVELVIFIVHCFQALYINYRE
ncbi:uncharacterized protein LOC142338719 isoform X3 [Convolutriloba macropyga]|uniref:uncharacterized protein LOC142338719 isoform X3 n=1 Tax=Convolutriloba macropyga TaxID=536237 RepID=UPI003F5251FA